MPFQKQNLSGFPNSPLKCICSQQLILNSRLCCCQASNQQGICSPILQHILQIKTRLKSLLDYLHNQWKIFKSMVDNFIFAWRLPDNSLTTTYLMILNSMSSQSHDLNHSHVPYRKLYFTEFVQNSLMDHMEATGGQKHPSE